MTRPTVMLVPALERMAPLMWYVLATGLALVITTLAWKRRYRFMRDPAKAFPLPPGSLGWPLVGETLSFVAQGSKFFTDRFKWYGQIYKTHLLGSPTVRVSGADLLRPLFNSEPQGLTMKAPASVRHLLGETSVVISKGVDHTLRKRKLLEAFTAARLNDYLPCIQEHMRSHMKSWCANGRIQGFQACERLVSDIILELVLGCRRENDQDGRVRTALMTINENLISAPIKIPGAGFYKASKAKEVVSDFVLSRLAGKGDKEHVSMMEVFLAGHGAFGNETIGNGQSGGLSSEELIDNSISMLITGSATTSSSLCCLLLLLGQHPEVMQELREELETVGLLSPDAPQELTYDLLQSLEFTQCIIKESLRVLPPAGGAFRRAERTLEVAGYQIPKDWTVVYSIRDTHQNSTVFNDVGEFKPGRWRDKKLIEKLHRESTCNYIPFGHGVRACLGKALATLQMSVFLVELVRLVTFELHNPHSAIVFLPVTKPADDLPVTFLSAREEKAK